MKTEKTENPNPPKPRGYRFWLTRLAILLGLPLLFYYGYCWGLWGRGSLLLQYLFQCGCPAASEEWRYPEYVDIVVSACQYISSSLSPSGRLLYVRTQGVENPSSYLLDLQTMESIDVTKEAFSSFLTDDLWLVERGAVDEVVDRTTGKRYIIQELRHWQEDAYLDGKPNLELLITSLQKSEQVFLTPNYNTVIVLMPNSEQGFLFDRSDFPEWGPRRVEQFLKENNIMYQTVSADFPYPNERVSPDNQFVARADGIYLVETGEKIVEGYLVRGLYHSYSGRDFSVRGWIHDGAGVIYSRYLNPCLIETNFLIFEYPACFIEVPQPVLLLRLPEEYLAPVSSP